MDKKTKSIIVYKDFYNLIRFLILLNTASEKKI